MHLSEKDIAHIVHARAPIGTMPPESGDLTFESYDEMEPHLTGRNKYLYYVHQKPHISGEENPFVFVIKPNADIPPHFQSPYNYHE
jgi:hypothetical protein